MKIRKIVSVGLALMIGLSLLAFSQTSSTNQAKADSVISTSKTAAPLDVNARTYKITMKAWSTELLAKPVADVILVLDKSGSMGQNNERIAVTSDPAEMAASGYLNRSSYDATRYAWSSNGTLYRPVRYNNSLGVWQIDNSRSFTDLQANNGSNWTASQINGDSWATFNPSQVTATRPLYGYKWALLQKSVNRFVRTLLAGINNGTLDPASTINIIDFAGDNSQSSGINPVTSGFVTINSANVTATINTLFNDAPNNGSTPTDQGLKAAYNALYAIRNNGHSKASILFTDGVPGASATVYDTGVANSAIGFANQIRGLPQTTMYAVGLFTKPTLQSNGTITAPSTNPNIGTVDVEKTFLRPIVGDTPSSSADDYLGQNYQRVTATNSLESIFDNIAEAIQQLYTIRDYLDPRFVPIDGSGNPLQPGDPVVGKDKDGNNVTGILKQDSKGLYVEWSRQMIPSPANESTAWSVAFNVKARDTYIGGLDVPTNQASANGSTGIYLENPDGSAPVYKTGFPQPIVDVKIRFDVANASDDIFLGDPVPTANGPKDMFNPQQVAYGSTTLNNSWINGTFTYAWYAADSNGNPTGSPVSATTTFLPPGIPGTDQYVLKVTYTPKKLDGSGALDPAKAVTSTGLYTLNVRTGTLTLKKRVTGYSGSDPDRFTFHIDGPGLQTDVVLTDQSQTTITGLPKGTYKITEIVPMEYTLDHYDVNSSSDQGSSVTVTIGKSSPSFSVTGNNKFQHQGYFHSTDSKDNVITQK